VATYQAVAATGQAILGLLADACPRDEFPGARFELYGPSDFKTPMDEGVSLYLYRIGVNTSRRSLPPRVGPDGRRFRPPLPLDLQYLLTAWARTAARQQRLLGWAVRALEDTPVLPAGLLNHFGPEPDVFQPHETVELICDPVSLQDLVNIWDPFKASTQLGMTYVARMVALDSALELREGGPVQVQARAFDHAGIER
jgi:hypothetical protein